ncbi:hypothetical protein TI04_11280 [Achromatium sp. WMS2]|nr:hypothetical protein TI04_11280 [Achromatium sp. WMS2]
MGSGFNGNSTNNSFGALRNSYVGLAGDFGTFFMGRHDTPLKMSTAKLDFFMDTMADNDDEGAFRPNPAINPTRLSTRGVGLFDGKRVGGVIALVSPSFFGFSMATALVQSNAGDTFAKADNFSGASSTALMYENGPFYGSIAYESIDARSLPSSSAGTSSIASNEVYNKWRFGVGILKFNNVSLSFIYEHGDETAFLTGADTSAWQLSGAYDLMSGIRVKGMYGEFDGDSTVGIAGFNTWALGLEYSLSNRTDIQVLYRAKDVNNTTKVGGLNLDDNVFAIQLDHSF